MGEVYRASDARLGPEVAIKILPQPSATDQQRMARFEREAGITSVWPTFRELTTQEAG